MRTARKMGSGRLFSRGLELLTVGSRYGTFSLDFVQISADFALKVISEFKQVEQMCKNVIGDLRELLSLGPGNAYIFVLNGHYYYYLQT